jgi:hypothetical protein
MSGPGGGPALTFAMPLTDQITVSVDMADPHAWHRVVGPTPAGRPDDPTRSAWGAVLDPGRSPAVATPLLRLTFLGGLDRWLDLPLDTVLLTLERAAAAGLVVRHLPDGSAGPLAAHGWRLAARAVADGAMDAAVAWRGLHGDTRAFHALVSGLEALVDALPITSDHEVRDVLAELSGPGGDPEQPATVLPRPEFQQADLALAAGTPSPTGIPADARFSRIDPLLVPARVVSWSDPEGLGEAGWWPDGAGRASVVVPAAGWVRRERAERTDLLVELLDSEGSVGGCLLRYDPEWHAFTGTVPVDADAVGVRHVVAYDAALHPLGALGITPEDAAGPEVIRTRSAVERLRTARSRILAGVDQATDVTAPTLAERSSSS